MNHNSSLHARQLYSPKACTQVNFYNRIIFLRISRMLRYFIFLANQAGLKGINCVQKWQLSTL